MRIALIFSVLMLRDSGEGDGPRRSRVKKRLEFDPLCHCWDGSMMHDYG
jgi:hypothetical protein